MYPDVVRDSQGQTTLAEHWIHSGSSPLTHQALLAREHRDMVERELQEMQRCSIISLSSSEWVSPMVLVKKRDRTLRLCVHYRRVNVASATEAYPLPHIDDIIDQIGRAQYLMTIDLTKVLASSCG